MKTTLILLTTLFIIGCAPDEEIAENVEFSVTYQGTWTGTITLDEEEVYITGTGNKEYSYSHYRSWYYISVQKDDGSTEKISVAIYGVTPSGQVVASEYGSSTSPYGIATASLMSSIY